jgi:hypothetical protein
MKTLLWSSMAALLILAAGAARADCGTCDAKTEKPAAAKVACPCMCVQGVTLTDEQKPKVDALQAKCKDDCSASCSKACKAELKKILTKEQFKQVQKNCKVCKKRPAAAKTEAPKPAEPKPAEAK